MTFTAGGSQGPPAFFVLGGRWRPAWPECTCRGRSDLLSQRERIEVGEKSQAPRGLRTPQAYGRFHPHPGPRPQSERRPRTPRLGKSQARDRSVERDDMQSGAETHSLSQRERVRVREKSQALPWYSHFASLRTFSPSPRPSPSEGEGESSPPAYQSARTRLLSGGRSPPRRLSSGEITPP